ncbi:MAG: DUF3224 domain-containing protein [Caldilineaceae bacterium]
MFPNLLRNRNLLARCFASLVVVCAAVIISAANVGAQSSCFQVHGYYIEHAVGQGQFAGTYSGTIQGDFATTVAAPFPIVNPPVNNVALFYANTVLHAQVHGKQGDLIIANAGAFQQAGDGNIIDLQIITGGTGELANASGAIRASGLFDLTSFTGSSQYEGMICLQ